MNKNSIFNIQVCLSLSNSHYDDIFFQWPVGCTNYPYSYPPPQGGWLRWMVWARQHGVKPSSSIWPGLDL
jgi:hypothetical protein